MRVAPEGWPFIVAALVVCAALAYFRLWLPLAAWGVLTVWVVGGPKGLGFVRGIKEVDPAEWFFTAHVYQDPVCPGSLGIESFLQLLKFAARERWPHLAASHRFAAQTGRNHRWTYRGQILPTNRRVTVEAAVTEVLESPHPALVAEGHLMVDGLYIYRMEEFGIQLIPG